MLFTDYRNILTPDEFFTDEVKESLVNKYEDYKNSDFRIGGSVASNTTYVPTNDIVATNDVTANKPNYIMIIGILVVTIGLGTIVYTLLNK